MKHIISKTVHPTCYQDTLELYGFAVAPRTGCIRLKYGFRYPRKGRVAPRTGCIRLKYSSRRGQKTRGWVAPRMGCVRLKCKWRKVPCRQQRVAPRTGCVRLKYTDIAANRGRRCTPHGVQFKSKQPPPYLEGSGCLLCWYNHIANILQIPNKLKENTVNNPRLKSQACINEPTL